MEKAMEGSREWAVVDEMGELRCGNLHASRKELQDVHKAFSSREKAIAEGVVLGTMRYEVHRHHPPLIYGREHRSDPEQSDGFALVRVQENGTGKKLCAIVIYPMPILSAYIVPRLVEACKQHVGEVQ